MKFLSLFLPLFLCACATQRYDPQPVGTAANEARFLARSPQDEGVRAFLAANGVTSAEWPRKSWSLHELTLLAYYFHPELEVARAYWDSVRAGAAAGAQRGLSGIDAMLEHHSRRSDNGERVSPWTLGIAFDYAFAGVAKREAQLARAQAQADAARWEVGLAAWRVRSGLRERLLALHAAIEREQALKHQRELQAGVQKVVEKRLAGGAASQLEANAARAASQEIDVRWLQAGSDARSARVALAQAVGLSAQQMQALQLDLAEFERAPAPDALPKSTLQRTALWQRSDILQLLSLYDAEDKRIKEEISKQYPDFRIEPGFTWDQEDNIWQLGWGVGLPLPKSNDAAIAQARAQRALQARRLYALQVKVLGDLEQASSNYQGAFEAIGHAQRAARLSEQQLERVSKRVAAGDKDRLDELLAQLESARAQIHLVQARSDAQRALGALEDVLQRPLAGAALPQLPGLARSAAQPR